MKYVLSIFLATTFLATIGCRSRSENGDLLSTASASYKNQLDTKDDYLGLVATNAAGFTHVKYSYELTGSDTIYFQNTAVYDFHLPFLSAEIPAYSGLTAQVFDELIFMPLPKDLSAGAIYYSDTINIPGSNLTGTMGFTIYQSTIDLDEIERVFKRMKVAIPFAADRLAFLFENSQQYFSNKIKLKQRGIPSMLATAFAGQGDKPIAYNAATSYGFLRKLSAAEIDAGNYTSRDILLLEDLPIDVGPTAGVISALQQMPHSHVVLRAINQKIPDIYIPNATSLPAANQNLGKLIELSVNSDATFTIKGEGAFAAGELAQKAEQYFKNRVPSLPEPASDLSVADFYSFKTGTPSPTLVKSYGAKGTNFSILDRGLRQAGVDRSKYQGSFLIPFQISADHIAQPLSEELCKKSKKECSEDFSTACDAPADSCKALAGKPATDFFAAMVTEAHVAKMLAEPAYRKGYLGFAQALIEKLPLKSSALDAIRKNIAASYPATTRMRFRSSTNAEDLPGLNGAGLYTSKGGCLADDNVTTAGPSACMTANEIARTKALITKLEALDANRYADMIADLKDDLTKRRPIEKALKKVMASLWNERAFLSRDYYRIPHMKVFMGILCHPSFADETANGVSVIKQAEDGSGDLLMSVVVQLDDISITNPEIHGAVPDQLSFKYSSNGDISGLVYGLHSNQIPSGQSILDPQQLADLARQMAVTYKSVRDAYGASALNAVLDMEFKRDGQGAMEMKQARPL